MDKIKSTYFKKTHEEAIAIKGQKIILDVGTIDHTHLKLWPNNPRIIHEIEKHNEILTQDEISEALNSSSNINSLKKLIEGDGFINEPLIVNEENWEVYEGNRRLLVNRILYAEALRKNIEPNPWIDIKVQLVPKGTDPRLVAIHLGSIQMIGKEDWDTYCKAAYLANQMEANGYDFKEMAEYFKNLYTLQEIKKAVNTYKFMSSRHHTKPDDYSVFELLESVSVIRKERENPGFDDFYYSQVNLKKWPAALDVRRELPNILKSPNKKLKKDFLEGKVSWNEALNRVKESRSDRAEIKKIADFKDFIIDPDVMNELRKLEGTTRGAVLQNLEKISKRCESYHKKLTGEKFNVSK